MIVINKKNNVCRPEVVEVVKVAIILVNDMTIRYHKIRKEFRKIFALIVAYVYDKIYYRST